MNQVRPLALASPDATARMVEIRAGGASKKLAAIRLTTGVTIKVINNQMPGPVIIDDLRGWSWVMA